MTTRRKRANGIRSGMYDKVYCVGIADRRLAKKLFRRPLYGDNERGATENLALDTLRSLENAIVLLGGFSFLHEDRVPSCNCPVCSFIRQASV